MAGVVDHYLWGIEAEENALEQGKLDQHAKIQRILRLHDPGVKDQDGNVVVGLTPKQYSFVIDESPYQGLRCPRRSGKSFGLAAKAVYWGEKKPNSRILIISVNLKATAENFWESAPAGIWAMDRNFNLGLKYNTTHYTWKHQNGSRGRLAGVETRADMETLRGAAAEADLVLIDEAASIPQVLLRELLNNVIEPGLMTRNGVVVLAGTPGYTCSGVFYEATWPAARDDRGAPTCIPVERAGEQVYAEMIRRAQENAIIDEDDVDAIAAEPWMLHSWAVKDNPVNNQWRKALRIKKNNRWDDDHPIWRREYWGEWVGGEDGMVYAYNSLRGTGKVTWYPDRARGNPSGLPPEDGPWHYVMGVDFGLDPDPCAIVLLAYSERIGELRHVTDFSGKHLLPDDLANVLESFFNEYGRPERIIGDPNALGGKVYIETLAQRHGIFLEKAETSQKNDHIELINGDFHAGRIKIIPGSDLDVELSALEWDLAKDTKMVLSRSGKLRENPKNPNHLCDALLYAWRYTYHYFARRDVQGPSPGTLEYALMKEREAEEREANSRGQKRSYGLEGYPGTDRSTTRTLSSEAKLWQPPRGFRGSMN